ncbi:hypothetical protein F5X99DRAFT_428075 [Biscogniauxia marginata]|nr:hypothetical protein F5X99DRAFT_428075 [Biscogniauxia marginata]
MVSFKNIFLLGVTLLSVTLAIPASYPVDLSVTDRATLLEGKSYVVESVVRSVEDNTDSTSLTKRAGRMTLQWSPQGRFLFLLGASFPQAVIDGFYGLGEGGPAKALLSNFHEWFSQNQLLHQRAWLLFVGSSKGGVYGKAGGAIVNDFGFAFDTARFYSASDIQDLLDAIYAWATQNGGIVQVIARPNGFFDPGIIGAGQKRDVEERSRGNTCPNNTNLLQYATEDVSTDIDINRDIRWVGECDEA